MKEKSNLFYILVILNINTLVLTLVIFLSRISYYIDKLSSNYLTDSIHYIPNIIYIVLGISFLLNIILFKKIFNKNNKNTVI